MFPSLTITDNIFLALGAVAILIIVFYVIWWLGLRLSSEDKMPGKDWHEMHEDYEKQIHK